MGKHLLIVVDMQNDFIDGTLGTKEAVSILPSVAEKLNTYRKDPEGEVVFTLDTHGDNYMDTQEGHNLPVPHCIKGTNGWMLHPELETEEFSANERRFEKPAFGSTALAEYAAKGDYDSIELIGLCTDICVISNALLLKAALPETPIKVDSRCCAGVTPESHENALKAMGMCQIQIL